jgi:hypothetical protein
VGHFPAYKFFLQTSICMTSVLGSQYGATTEAAESLIAHLDSQDKLTTPRRENRKKNEILKANEHALHV